MSLASRLKVAAIGGLAAIVLSACGSAQSTQIPTDTPVVTASASPSPYVSPTVSPKPHFPAVDAAIAAGYTPQQIIDYYMEIALGSEFSPGTSGFIWKWGGPIRIYAHNATDYDLTILKKDTGELKELTNLDISIVNSPGFQNIDMYFTTASQFPSPFNDGSADGYTVPSAHNGVLDYCSIYIDSQRPDLYRNVAILEETTQSLGLFNDSLTYQNSVFYDPFYPLITSLTPIDRALVEIHYWDKIKNGMMRPQVEDLLSNTLLPTSSQ